MTEENYLEGTSQDEMVSVYVYSLMEDKGENPEDIEAHKALKQQVVGAVNDAIIDALPEEKAEELNKLFEQDEATPEKVAEVVASAGIDTQAITEQTLEKFREDYLGDSEVIENEEQEEE